VTPRATFPDLKGASVFITDTKALQRAIEQAGAAHGPITVLVNNAANDARHTTEQVGTG
jgi:NAD(P)-dependent dehydrogenase (short-subunit alcohol dehydrogenase family)